MGQVFQRTYKGKDGTLRTCDTFTIRYFRGGRAHEEATKLKGKTAARALLKIREGAIASGVPVSATSARYRFDDAVKDIVADYANNQRRSLGELERRIKLHLAPWFGGWRLADITGVDVRAFTHARLLKGASAGEVNRELSILTRMFTLAIQANVLTYKPHIAKLDESGNVRKGYLDAEQVNTVIAALPAAVAPVIRFAFVTGWRIQSEVLPMEWRQVDRKLGDVRLDPGTTKNKAGRVFPFTDELRELFDEQWRQHAALKDTGTICPYVFQRNGRRLKSIRGAWAAACVAVGVPGRVPHDLRRSAVRTMERRGLSRSVAMQLTGHKTESVYRRYAITSEGDLQEAARRLDRDSIVTVGRSDGRAAAR